MSFVQGETSNDKIPVALGLKGKNLYLSCVMKDGTPTLQLEVSAWHRESAPIAHLRLFTFTHFPDIHLPHLPETVEVF